MNLKKTSIATAVTLAMGGMAGTASAQVINVSFDGVFTMLNGGGEFTPNTDTGGAPYFGNRTAITGTMHFNTKDGSGSGTVVPFSFFGNGLASATTITFQAIGDGAGNPNGPLVLGNMGFNWNDNNGIPVSIVMDASGFFGAVGGGLSTSDVITGGSLPASNGVAGSSKGGTYTVPIGPGPVVTTTWNTTTIGTPILGTNPSGTLPLITDTVGGSPMPTAPFKGFNANFDITSLTVTSVLVPVPAAVWLFGSGLLGLVGVARRRKRS